MDDREKLREELKFPGHVEQLDLFHYCVRLEDKAIEQHRRSKFDADIIGNSENINHDQQGTIEYLEDKTKELEDVIALEVMTKNKLQNYKDIWMKLKGIVLDMNDGTISAPIYAEMENLECTYPVCRECAFFEKECITALVNRNKELEEENKRLNNKLDDNYMNMPVTG